MRELLGTVLHEIAQVLDSAERSEERMLRVLELLRRIVPYEQSALLHARPGGEPRLLVAPAAQPGVRATLSGQLVNLHRRLVDDRAQALTALARRWRAHLAVPLIGNDEAIGILFVSLAPSDGAAGAYTEQNLRELSIVGTLLAAYLVMADQARRLDEARHEAEAANRMKDEFLALMSHELKTPLHSMLVWTEMLRSEGMGPTARGRAVEAIERNVHTQVSLIDDVLDLSCIAAADLRLDLVAVQPTSLIKAAVEQQQARADRKSIRLDTAHVESLKELVVDPVRIVQVISNLLANAIQFTPNGGYVGVRMERAGARARIQVIDHGKGIAPEVLPRVFESFRGGHRVIRARGELGVGLAIVKTLVEAHGGRVRAESSGPEKGSTFTVELPLSPAEAQELDATLLAGIRVVLVDADDDMRIAAGAVLEHYGADVTAVASAAAALAALECSRPHVLISDLSMPGESAYDLMLKVAARDAALPSAALTSFGTREARARAFAAGFRMCLAKPLEAQTLVRAVATLTGRPLADSLGPAIAQ
jgi:signal transduction histidine kinase/CheY-like chemotaxis protein